MENFFEVHLGHGEQHTTYLIRDDEQPKQDGCKFEVFLSGRLILSLGPEGDHFLTCSNPGNLDDATISHLIDKIEARYL